MRRSFALVLVVVGLVTLVVGLASGCGTLFSFNGRHPIAVQPLVPGTPLRSSFKAKAGMRYTLAVHVVFEREGLPEANGHVVVEGQFPIMASITDASGDAAAKVVGWIDPNEPPTVLYGHAASAHQRRPAGVPEAELVAERLVGPYGPAVDREVGYVVDLGTDRTGKARIREARVVVFDDKLPTSITVAFVAAAGGAIALVTGTIMLFFGLFRARRGGTRRRQIV
ncbi:MAG: hypothetical protein JWP87_1718 [Labilithrix sp.]|nr:hypothetical protein [Labilithrix sp.]